MPKYEVVKSSIDLNFVNSLFINQDFILANKPVDDFYICKICNGLVNIYNIKCCDECQDLFCGLCIENKLKISQNCPSCNKSHFNNYKLHRSMKSALESIIIKCPFNCLKEIRNGDLITHLIDCEKFPKTLKCQLCEEEIKLDENITNNRDLIEKHNKSCMESTSACCYCKQDIKNNFSEYHEISCPAKQYACENCKVTYTKQYEKAHFEYYCSKISHLRKIFFEFLEKINL